MPQADTGLPNSASRINPSTEITNRRTGGTRSVESRRRQKLLRQRDERRRGALA